MKREVYGENKEVGNIGKKIFVIVGVFLKKSKKKKLMATN